jgi:hypothetical protein
LLLSKSLRRAHPDWSIQAILVDEGPAETDMALLQDAFDGILEWSDLGIPNAKSWLFKHDVVEACTAVKAHAMLRLMERFDKVIYLDPDIAVFHPLNDLLNILDHHSIVLTPHQTDPNLSFRSVHDNEMASLRYGVFNLGFIAVRADKEGRRFADWWASHLYRACYDDLPNGVFTDQKCCDLVPALFKRVYIQRDPGYNVASWNLSNRSIKILHGGSIEVNAHPLRFFHFTKIGGDGELMVKRYAGDNLAVFELWEWYRRQLEMFSVDWINQRSWAFGTFHNGRPISRSLRILFRLRHDLQTVFNDPFDASPGGFLDWIRDNEPTLFTESVASSCG